MSPVSAPAAEAPAPAPVSGNLFGDEEEPVELNLKSPLPDAGDVFGGNSVDGDFSDDTAVPDAAQDNGGGVLPAILLAVSLVVLLAVTLMTTSHYLAFDHGIDIELPGLSAVNK